MTLHWLSPSIRADAFRFYNRFMPYARLNKKELVGVIYAESSPSNQIIAAVRLRPIGEYQLVTGMLVHPHYRGQALGHQLMSNLQEQLIARPSFLFSLPELTAFYRQHRFFESSETKTEQCADIPAEISQLYKRYVSKGKQLCLMQHRP
ncbi:GNAT family N-acetyltransferase [Shewanella psychrotolerans]|uniref:GNAT family N-acetyltransferase n=1 Tax=Shewanella psychrotolerans TaxID=2864206 RepID=UPI001C65507B|nr:GNAT family N-acetyltransferase [Shewanella psychrotolerans]QYK02344.1 GNAT family N-acetyltransferase [Shewanella psychrotolerans]